MSFVSLNDFNLMGIYFSGLNISLTLRRFWFDSRDTHHNDYAALVQDLGWGACPLEYAEKNR